MTSSLWVRDHQYLFLNTLSWSCGDDKEPSTYGSDILFPKMTKWQGDFLHFLNVKKVKTDTESSDSNKNYCGLSKSKELDFKYAEQPIIEEKPSSSSKEKNG